VADIRNSPFYMFLKAFGKVSTLHFKTDYIATFLDMQMFGKERTLLYRRGLNVYSNYQKRKKCRNQASAFS
ncbi:MAG: hypothetical protein RR754_08410, partial [Oscillospiraceae bacterium]